MKIRKATAVWEGSFKEGGGRIRLESGLFDAPYSAAGRFEEGEGTNPDELLGAAEAACFTMALALALTQKGHPPQRIETEAEVSIEKEANGYRIQRILLRTEADVPGMDAATFRDLAETAKSNCPVGATLKGTEIKLEIKRFG